MTTSNVSGPVATASSTGTLTPQSSSTISPRLEPADKATSSSKRRTEADVSTKLARDQALPSIEGNGDTFPSEDGHTTTTRPSSTSELRGKNSTAKGKAALREGHEDNLVSGIRNVRLSSSGPDIDVSDMSIAIENIANSPGNNSILRESTYLGVDIGSSGRPRRRSRSNSQNRGPPHNVADEELIDDHFHEPAVQQAFRDAKELMSELAAVLGSGSFQIGPDSTLQRLHKEAEKLASFQCASSRTVGFVGDSGVGTLLHKGDLCTNLTLILPR